MTHVQILDLKSLATALLLFEAVHAAGLFRRGRPVAGDLLWAAPIAAISVVAARYVFGPDTCFLPVLGALLGVSLLRTALGAIDERTGMLERWRYAFPAAYGVISQDAWGTAGLCVLLAVNRRDLRALMLALARLRGPALLSPLDVDAIVPAPVVYEREKREKGFTLIEAIIGMTLLATVSMALFSMAAGRAARLRQVRETSVVREAAVSELEQLLATPFEELAGRSGEEFAVSGDGEPGRVLVTFPEEGLARIVVLAPRRGAAPVRLETYRTRRAP